MDSAASANGEWIGAANCYAGGAAECVCRNAKAQGFDLRAGRRRDATSRLRVSGMALASHYGINLISLSGAAEHGPGGVGELASPNGRVLASGERLGNLIAWRRKFPLVTQSGPLTLEL